MDGLTFDTRFSTLFSQLGAITPGFTQTMQLFDALADLSEWVKLLVHFVQSIEKEKTRLLGQPGAKTKRIMHFWFLLIVRMPSVPLSRGFECRLKMLDLAP